MTDKTKQTLVEKAKADYSEGNAAVLAAVILAQAMDRLGEKLTEAAAMSQYRRS